MTAVNVNTGLTRTSTVGANGGCSFSSLPVGTYRLELTTPQGKRQTDEFALNVAQNAVLDFDFSQPDIAEGGDDAIIVTGSRIRSMEGGEVGTNISQRLIEVLPQNNRNFLAFADLAPGVQFLTNSANQTSLRGGAQGAQCDQRLHRRHRAEGLCAEGRDQRPGHDAGQSVPAARDRRISRHFVKL